MHRSGLVVLVALVVALAVSSTAAAHTGYSSSIPDVDCTNYRSYGALLRSVVSVDSPAMLPHSTLSRQEVSWQPIIWTWSGSAWTQIAGAYSPILRGSTGWTGVPSFGGWNVTPGFYYRVSIVYRWYLNGSVVHVDHLWAGTHTQFGVDDRGGLVDWTTGQSGAFCYVNE